MSALVGASKLHKKQFYAYLASTGTTVTVRQPVPQSTPATAVTRVLGTPVTANGSVGQLDTVKAVLNYGYTAGTSPFANFDAMPAAIRAIGQAENIDVLLRCRVEDVLIEDSMGGRTLFDTCKDVLIDGMLYKVTATDRTGLPPLGPYVYWVALKKNGSANV